MTIAIKYCGNQSYSDYLLVRESQATYIGLIFVKGSKRYVTPTDAASWIKETPLKPHQRIVGVFVNPDRDSLKQVLEAIPLDVIQLHGTESPEFLKTVRTFFSGEIWKAIHHKENALETMKRYRGSVDGYLVDSKVTGAWGGTGQSFDWAYVPRYLEEARKEGVPCFIAGGVNADNVEALLKLNPDGIDLASGIEEGNEKSHTRIQALERKVVPK